MKVSVTRGLVLVALSACSLGTHTSADTSGNRDVSDPSLAVLAVPPYSWRPTGMFGPDKALYVSDCGRARVLRVDQDGNTSEFAGAGPGGFMNGFSGDGGPATEAHFGCPIGLAWDAKGRLFVMDHLNGRVRMIDEDGMVTTVAGGGPLSDHPGLPGDGGPATQAAFDGPSFLNFDAAGDLYVTDGGNNRIRMVDARGIITTIAGTGKPGFAGDGVPATQARFSDPAGLAFDRDGNLYVADYDNGVVRKIDPRGIVTTVAGTGKIGSSGDEGPAMQALLDSPNTLSFDHKGRLYITEDSDHPRVRVLDLDEGTISTFADL
jgi:DNA-binding beta-propeller fold protein YncE